MDLFTHGIGRHLARLYLSWGLSAISSIGIVLALVSLVLGLDRLHLVNDHVLLLLLPVTAYQWGKLNGPFLLG